MKEIVSIQVGGFSNYVGAHFWNIQDELLGVAGDGCLDPDVLYRTGESGSGGVLLSTPRLLSIDLPGSLGCLTYDAKLCPNKFPDSSSSPSFTWTGKVSTHVTPHHKKNLFLQRLYSEDVVDDGGNTCDEISDEHIVENLETENRFWTDFSKVQYHPLSLYQLNGLWSDGFDDYGIGKEAFSGSVTIRDDLNDRLRFFVEECDYLQGFQFTVDDSGGFSGVAVEFLENIVDQYPKIPVLLYTSRPPVGSYQSRKQMISRGLHDAISFSRLSSLSDLIVPTGLSTLGSSKAASFLRLDDTNPYHCGAVYASAFHSATFQFQMPSALGSNLVSGAVEMNVMAQMLSSQTGRKTLAILDVAIPPSPLSGERFECSLLENLQPLMPDTAVDIQGTCSVDFISVQGILESGGCQTAPIHKMENAVLSEYDNSVAKPKHSHISAALCPLPIPMPFPSIFAYHVSQRVKLLRTPAMGSTILGSLDLSSIPVATRLRSCAAALPFLHKRLGDLRRYGIERGAVGVGVLSNWGFEKDDLVEMGEGMFGMVKALDFDSFISSDSD